MILKENSSLREKQEQIYSELSYVKQQLANERKKGIELKTEKTNFYAQRSQLEELFLSCVEETRKSIERRRAQNLARSNSIANNFQKDAFKFNKLDNLEQAIKLEHFTASDKCKVLELLLSNENVLLFLYEKLFPRAQSNPISTLSNGLLQYQSLSAPVESQYENFQFRPKTAQAHNLTPHMSRKHTTSKTNLKHQTGKPIKFRQMSSAGFGDPHASEATRSQSHLGAPNLHSDSNSALTINKSKSKNPGFASGGFSTGNGRKM